MAQQQAARQVDPVDGVAVELQGLTLRAAPLQTKTYELQERTERLMGGLLRLSLARTKDDAGKVLAVVGWGELGQGTARLAEAFEVCGKIGPAAPMLVLRLSSEIETNPEVLQELLDSLRAVFAGPVILIPFDWTQEQIDAEAVRLAVLAEREACARIVESGSFGWWEDIGDLREAVAAMIRARGSK